jgi:hypothetical protein
MTPAELDALAAEAGAQRRVLATALVDLAAETGVPVGRLHAKQVADIDAQWPRLAALIAAYAVREPPC